MKRYTKEVLLTFDSDSAGIQAALRAIPILKEAGLSVKIVDMNPYKDPDDFIKALGIEAYQERIDQAKSSFFFEIDMLQKNYDLSDPEQKTKFFYEIAKRLVGFQEELERNVYLDAVAKNYQIDVEHLSRLVNKFGAQGIGIKEIREEPRSLGKRKIIQDDGISKAQKLLLTWLVEDNSLFEKIKNIVGPEDFSEGIYYEVAKLVFEQFEKDHAVIPAKIINCFEDKEVQSEVAALFNASIRGEMNEADWKKALSDTIIRIKENSLDIQSKKAIEDNDMALLQRVIAEKANLKKHTIL